MTQNHVPISAQTSAGVGALFDLSFSRFITISFIKVIYLIGMVGIALGWVALLIGGLQQGVIGLIVAGIIGFVLAVIYLIFLRVSLEVIVVIFRIGENTSAIAAAQGVSTGGFPVSSTGLAV